MTGVCYNVKLNHHLIIFLLFLIYFYFFYFLFDFFILVLLGVYWTQKSLKCNYYLKKKSKHTRKLYLIFAFTLWFYAPYLRHLSKANCILMIFGFSILTNNSGLSSTSCCAAWHASRVSNSNLFACAFWEI